ncbi:flagellar biosynthesis anti-sigma factor FlgM [Dehalobacter sp. DCM]|uniref:flagellar biosynthesis anti-sigma factor FlgM n=1 Tax=Dehalobacter sp. DCM TaxID=2907827 RepID=UPI0030814FFF|nr:flagellar biosynthesis anti-sigma factor FlgM [Dehalobacter sp. DCM]
MRKWVGVSMKIEGTSTPSVSGIQAVSRAAKIERSNPITEQDNINVSQDAQVYQKLVQKTKELPDIREDKVKAISEQIAKGEFSFDAASIAEGILSSKETGG